MACELCPVGKKSLSLSSFTIDELSLALVFSTKAHARLVKVDPSEALSLPGVKAYISRDDIPGNKLYGVSQRDEELFANDIVCVNLKWLADSVSQNFDI